MGAFDFLGQNNIHVILKHIYSFKVLIFPCNFHVDEFFLISSPPQLNSRSNPRLNVTQILQRSEDVC